MTARCPHFVHTLVTVYHAPRIQPPDTYRLQLPTPPPTHSGVPFVKDTSKDTIFLRVRKRLKLMIAL